MSVWEMRTFDPDERLLLKLCLELNYFTPEQMENIIQTNPGKQMIFAFCDSGYLSSTQISELFRLWKNSFLCPRCDTVNFQEEQGGQLFCKKCHQLLDTRRVPCTGKRAQYGKYKIVKEIAEGSVGVVYEAVHVKLNRVVALKILKYDQLTTHVLKRFEREAQASASLAHPNIVQVYDTGEDYGVHYIAMEYVKGKPLSELIRYRKLTTTHAAEIATQVACGLAYAHQHHIIHRDIKPENILIAEDGTPKITDFGLARNISEGVHLTQQNTIMGTPLYMSPEQAMGSDNIGPTTDIYSLGVVLYEMLIGRPPFYHNSTMILLQKICNEAPLGPRTMQPSIPLGLEQICLKAMAKNPEERFATAQDMQKALEQFCPAKSKQQPSENVASLRDISNAVMDSAADTSDKAQAVETPTPPPLPNKSALATSLAAGPSRAKFATAVSSVARQPALATASPVKALATHEVTPEAPEAEATFTAKEALNTRLINPAQRRSFMERMQEQMQEQEKEYAKWEFYWDLTIWILLIAGICYIVYRLLL